MIMDFYTQVELPTNDGRMDVIIQTPNYIYIIECKLDGSAEEALQQLEAKKLCRSLRNGQTKSNHTRHQLLQQDKRSRELGNRIS